MIYAECQEYQTYYKILNMLEFEDIKDYQNSLAGLENFVILPLNNLAINKINETLPNLNVITEALIILKPFGGTVSAFNIHRISLKELLPDNTDINNLKNSYMILISRFFDTRINTIANLTYYEFTILNNELSDRGIFITDSNKEEKYIEILELEDDTLIDILERYLICKDEISRAYAAYDTYRKFKQGLNDLTTTDEVQVLASQFISEWNAKADYIQVMA